MTTINEIESGWKSYEYILFYLIIATLLMVNILLFYAAYQLVGLRHEWVQECVAMNEAANATVCLV